MAETKSKESSSLRQPKAKKTLGLSVPPALRMPHEDLIQPPTAVPEYRTTGVPESLQLPDIKEQLPNYRSTAVPQYRSTAVPETNFYKKANEAADALDRHLTPAESKVFEHLLRLTVGFQRDERQVRVALLAERTGYGSDKTVRLALAGLEQKGVIARIGRPNNPSGVTYRILSYSGTPVLRYSGRIYRSTPVDSTGVLKTDLKEQNTDDEAFAKFLAALKAANREVTGKEPSISDLEKWAELAELLVTELKIAAGRTGSVSSVPAFLTEHLRRRLWKKDKRQVEEEGKSEIGGHEAEAKGDASKCPDCYGTGMWYPEGFDKGVARCTHEKLKGE